MPELAIVISGLPASGKTTLGRKLAEKLELPFLDKDDFLEALFEEEGVGDRAWRLELSQKSNIAFQSSALEHQNIVLVSHWRPLGGTGTSGTPTEWLGKEFAKVVEVFCDCPTEEAVTRFIMRKRHKGHCDQDRDIEEIRSSFAKYRNYLPLNLGPVIGMDTSTGSISEQSISILAERIVRS